MTDVNDYDDLEDLIEKEVGLDWPSIKFEIPGMPTRKLVELMVYLGPYVNKYLATEIARRDDAVFWLRKLVQDGRHWRDEGPGDGWSPVHAIHILAIMKSDSAMDLLLDVLRYYGEDLGDLLTEVVPSLLYSFGTKSIDRQMLFVSDETLEAFVRGAGISSLTALMRDDPSRLKDYKEFLTNLLFGSIEETVSTMAADELASLRDPSVLPDIYKAYEQDRIDTSFCPINELEATVNGEFREMDEEDVRRNTKDPLEHFSRKNIEHLYTMQTPLPDNETPPDIPPMKKKKIGRNEPCPCGSGIKYKKCCGKNG